MPGLFTPRKAPAVSLVQDQDVFLVDADKADLTIPVIGAVEGTGVKHVTDVLVSKSVCMSSRYLRPIINNSDDPTEIILGGEMKRSGNNKTGRNKGENHEGILVMLAHIHGLTEQRMEQLELYNISVLGVWYAMAYKECDERGSAKETLKAWFTKCYATSMAGVDLDIDSVRGLTMPTQIFDHAVAFARVTKWLAYNHIGHVKERPPKGF
jgi:hypothetical protein